MSNPGARPGGGDQFANAIQTVNLMIDRRQGLSPREALTVGVGKAHRQVVYAHYEFRNYARSYLGDTGRVR